MIQRHNIAMAEDVRTLVGSFYDKVSEDELLAPIGHWVRPCDIFRTLATGLNGTRMVSFADSIPEAQKWDIVAYVLTLRRNFTRARRGRDCSGGAVAHFARRQTPVRPNRGAKQWEHRRARRSVEHREDMLPGRRLEMRMAPGDGSPKAARPL